jgi:chorismate mutase
VQEQGEQPISNPDREQQVLRKHPETEQQRKVFGSTKHLLRRGQLRKSVSTRTLSPSQMPSIVETSEPVLAM